MSCKVRGGQLAPKFAPLPCSRPKQTVRLWAAPPCPFNGVEFGQKDQPAGKLIARKGQGGSWRTAAGSAANNYTTGFLGAIF